MKVLVLGAGKMVEAILSGLKKTENLSEWMIYSPSGSSAKKLAGKVGATFVKDLSDVKNPDWVMIGCKPQQLTELKETLKGRFKDSLFISILATLSEGDQLKTLGVNSLIRVMPNLPVEFNEGVVLLSSSSARERLSSFKSYFGRLGEVVIVQEEELEELTLLTGSGPAFFYEFALNLSQGFTSLSPEEREKLARQVLKGAGVAVKNTNLPLSVMTDAVTSKGGVTIAVLEQWRKSGLVDLLKKGIEAGKIRTEEIKSLLRK
ncbi:MAG: pyrroline-5-carboxylate reductase family protein [Bacteriovoracia bacterium]